MTLVIPYTRFEVAIIAVVYAECGNDCWQGLVRKSRRMLCTPWLRTPVGRWSTGYTQQEENANMTDETKIAPPPPSQG